VQILLGTEASQKPAMPALEEREEAFFTEGPDELKAARLWILDYSLPRYAGSSFIPFPRFAKIALC
jgi:hypothetical protein